jgi:hypothetical protein
MAGQCTARHYNDTHGGCQPDGRLWVCVIMSRRGLRINSLALHPAICPVVHSDGMARKAMP